MTVQVIYYNYIIGV